jgi:hypothetical protein
MRALLIDSEHKTITEVGTDGTLADMGRLLGSKLFEGVEGVVFVKGSLSKGGDMLYCDEAGLFVENLRHFHQIDGGHPIPGKGLVLGVDKDGESCSASISIDELAPRISFSQRRFRGTRSRSGPGFVEVEADLPIIDGTTEETED